MRCTSFGLFAGSVLGAAAILLLFDAAFLQSEWELPARADWRALRLKLRSLRTRQAVLERAHDRDISDAASTSHRNPSQRHRMLAHGSNASASAAPSPPALAGQLAVARAYDATSLSMPSPAAAAPPPTLLRIETEGGCLHYTEPLELLSRGACDVHEQAQLFIWE